MAHDPDREAASVVENSRPVGLDLALSEQVLRITWGDGAESEFPMDYLRRHCPCASCRTEREKPAPLLLILSAKPGGGEIRATGGQLVGNYALQIEWSDGHNTGIYDFRLLRALHPGLPRG